MREQHPRLRADPESHSWCPRKEDKGRSEAQTRTPGGGRPRGGGGGDRSHAATGKEPAGGSGKSRGGSFARAFAGSLAWLTPRFWILTSGTAREQTAVVTSRPVRGNLLRLLPETKAPRPLSSCQPCTKRHREWSRVFIGSETRSGSLAFLLSPSKIPGRGAGVGGVLGGGS